MEIKQHATEQPMGHYILCLKHNIVHQLFHNLYTCKEYLKNKKKEILLFATTWMNLGDTLKRNNLDIETNIMQFYLSVDFFFFKLNSQ